MTQLKAQSSLVKVYLESGLSFSCRAYGVQDHNIAELVFNTALSGIVESLTDPSFYNQLVVTSAAHIGQTGVHLGDQESESIWAQGFVCRHLDEQPSNWRSQKNLIDWVVEQNRFVLYGVNTRDLVKHLRDNGSQRVIVGCDQKYSFEQLSALLKNSSFKMNGRELCQEVSTQQSYFFKEQLSKDNCWPYEELISKKFSGKKIGVWDFGVKKNTLRLLKSLGFEVEVFPASWDSKKILDQGFDALLLSNGPGDPAASVEIISEVKSVLGKIPVFAICLGYQFVALALGAKTHKMEFGHRGIHHPVNQLDEQSQVVRTLISSQNHGFAVLAESLPKECHVTYVHSDDQSLEGFSYASQKIMAVQFHPEAAPGPVEGSILLEEFFKDVLS